MNHRHSKIAGLFLVIIAAGACSIDAATDPASEDVSEAEQPIVADTDTDSDLRAGRQAEVDSFMNARSEGWDIRATRVTEGGQVVDYVSIESLYPDAPDAPFTAPPAPTEKVLAETAQFERGFTDFEADPSLVAPPGTLPVIRPSFDDYVSGVVGAQSPSQIIGKDPPGLVDFTNQRLYGVHNEFRSNIGTSGNINIWNYKQVGSSEMSLLQSATICDGSDSKNTMEAIEVGFQKQPQKFGDSKVHTFTFFRTAGGAQGDLVGGYNMDFKGFIQAAGAPFPPGAAMSANSYSTVGGAQLECHVETQLFQGNWWVNICGSWIGFYPTKSSSVSASRRINFDLIGTKACRTDWYGEIADPTPSSWTTADMGSGKFASEGYGRAAYIRQPFVLLSATSSDWLNSSVPTGGTGTGYDTDCYTVSPIFANGGTGWTRWFYVGGPGGDNATCK